MPLYRRLPKLPGRPMGPGHTMVNYGLLKLSVLNGCSDNSEVTYETCLEKGLMTKVCPPPPPSQGLHDQPPPPWKGLFTAKV